MLLILQNTRDTGDVDNHWVLCVVSGCWTVQLQMEMMEMMVVVMKLEVVMEVVIEVAMKRPYHYELYWV